MLGEDDRFRNTIGIDPTILILIDFNGDACYLVQKVFYVQHCKQFS